MEMLTCDICDDWYHLTCINLTQETAQELSAWICHQCKANTGSVDFLKDNMLQSTGAIQELRHELAILKNKVIQSSVAEGNKNSDEFHGSEQSKLSFNIAHKPVPYNATTPQTRLPSQHLNTQDSTQHRLSYFEGKVESIYEMFKFLMEGKRRNDILFTRVIAKRQCQCTPGRKSRQDPTTGSCAGSYRILCRILKNPEGPFEDFYDSKFIPSILQDL